MFVLSLEHQFASFVGCAVRASSPMLFNLPYVHHHPTSEEGVSSVPPAFCPPNPWTSLSWSEENHPSETSSDKSAYASFMRWCLKRYVQFFLIRNRVFEDRWLHAEKVWNPMGRRGGKNDQKVIWYLELGSFSVARLVVTVCAKPHEIGMECDKGREGGSQALTCYILSSFCRNSNLDFLEREGGGP